jgi:hypothetical protein
MSETAELTRPDEPARAVETYRQFLAEEVWDWVVYIEAYERDCADDRANGNRPHYCIHGTNMWVDWDCACGACEEGLTVWDMAERSAWDRHARYLAVLDELIRIRKLSPTLEVPAEVTDAYLGWLVSLSPAPLGPNTESREER